MLYAVISGLLFYGVFRIHRVLKERARRAIENYNEVNELFRERRAALGSLIEAALNNDVDRFNKEINSFIEDLTKRLIEQLNKEGFISTAIRVLSMPLLGILAISMLLLALNSMAPILDLPNAREVAVFCILIGLILALPVMAHTVLRDDRIEPLGNVDIEGLLKNITKAFAYEFSHRIIHPPPAKRLDAETSTHTSKSNTIGSRISSPVNAFFNTMYYVMQYITPSTVINALESENEDRKEPPVQRILLACIDCESSSRPYDMCYEELGEFLRLQFPGSMYLFVNKDDEWRSLSEALLCYLGFNEDDINEKIRCMKENSIFIGNRVYKLKFATWFHKLLVNTITDWRFITFCAGSHESFGVAYIVPFSLLFGPRERVAIQQGRDSTIGCKNSADVIFIEAYGHCANRVLIALTKALKEAKIHTREKDH
ncbi:MAG: hypothetical protein QXK62_07970 [Thermoproteus sp.]